MPRKPDNEGELFDMQSTPECIGYLVVDGVHYEIVGVRRSPIRTELKARRRGPAKEKQTDMFEGSDDDTQAGCV